jgi:hypothetical protein
LFGEVAGACGNAGRTWCAPARAGEYRYADRFLGAADFRLLTPLPRELWRAWME